MLVGRSGLGTSLCGQENPKITGERKACFLSYTREVWRCWSRTGGWLHTFVGNVCFLSLVVLPWPKIATQFWPRLCLLASEEDGTKSTDTLSKDLGAVSHWPDFPGGSDGKASAYNAGDLGSIPGSGRFPGEGYGNPLQYSCLENPMDGGASWATVRGVAKSWT